MCCVRVAPLTLRHLNYKMTEPTISLDARKLFNLSMDVLMRGFINRKPDDAKRLFKELKDGERVVAGTMTVQGTGANIPVRLDLDRSEFRGRFNFPNFDHCLRAMLHRFQTEIRKDRELKNLRTLTNENTGGLCFNIPSIIEIEGQINVLMLAVEPLDQELIIRLMFVDPDQFKSKRAEQAVRQSS